MKPIHSIIRPLCVFIFTLMPVSLVGQMALDIISISEKEIVFTFDGTFTGDPASQANQWRFEDVNDADWISNSLPDSSSGPLWSGYLGADPTNSTGNISAVFFADDNWPGDDSIAVNYDTDFTNLVTGTGSQVTLTLPGTWSINVDNVTEIALVWGLNNSVDEPYVGEFQSSVSLSAVPEPSSYAAILGGIALVGVSCRRRRRLHA